jgi:hypothetical protein
MLLACWFFLGLAAWSLRRFYAVGCCVLVAKQSYSSVTVHVNVLSVAQARRIAFAEHALALDEFGKGFR